MRLTTEQLTSLARLAKFPDGVLLVEILRGRLAEREQQLKVLEGNELYRQQGRVREIEEFLRLIADAQVSLNRAQSTPSQANRPVLR